MALHASGFDTGRSQVEVCVLGSFRLLKAGAPVSLKAGGKGEQLLGNLALRLRDGMPRESLLENLWPDADASLAGQSLNTLVHSLRLLLGDALADRPPVVLSGGRYLLNQDAGVVVDAARFDEAAATGDRLVVAGDHQGALASYASAVALYAGDLAFGSDVVALVERERLRSRYLVARSRLADSAFAEGDHGEAMAHALDLLAHDPCREDAHRMVMRCLVRLGARSQALRQYNTCRTALLLEFDAVPEEATEALFELIRVAPSRA